MNLVERLQQHVTTLIAARSDYIASDVTKASEAIQRLRTTMTDLLKEYRAERDCFYDNATNLAGEYDDPDDERIVKEMDGVIDAVEAILKATEA